MCTPPFILSPCSLLGETVGRPLMNKFLVVLQQQFAAKASLILPQSHMHFNKGVPHEGPFRIFQFIFHNKFYKIENVAL